MTAAVALWLLAAAALPLEAIPPDRSVAVVVSLAVNLAPEALDRAAAGLELAFARSDARSVLVRVLPGEAPPSCGSNPDCAESVRTELGVDEVWFLVLARVGDVVRIDGARWDGAPRTLDPFVAPVARLDRPETYGATPAAGPPAPLEASTPRDHRRVPAGTWALGAVSATSLAVGVGFGVAALSNESALEADGCEGGGCGSARVDRLAAYALTADVAFGVAAASAIGAVVLYFAAPRRGALAPSLAPTPGGGALLLRGRF